MATLNDITLGDIELDPLAGLTLDDIEIQPAEGSGFWRQAADLPVSAAGGVITGLKGMTDLFGANNSASQELASYQQFYNQSLSPEAQADQQEVARIMQEAQDKGVWEQVKAGARAFAVAPLDTAAQSLGTMAPIVATGVAGRAFGLGAKGVQAVQAGAGAGMNTGIVKDSIYQDTKNFLLQSGKSEEEADRVALEAQSYGGQNVDQLLLAAGLGAADALFGAEKILGNAISKSGGRVTGGVVAGAVKTGVSEGIPEAFQGGQEAMAPNIALQREGYAVPTMRGVASSATMEGLSGFMAGAPVGAAEGMAAPRVEGADAPTMSVGPDASTFTPPPAADTVEVQETFGDVTTAAAPDAEPAINPDDFEVVEMPGETIVTEPPVAPAFQFDLADDTTTAPEVDAGADVFSGVPQQQPLGPQSGIVASQETDGGSTPPGSTATTAPAVTRPKLTPEERAAKLNRLKQIRDEVMALPMQTVGGYADGLTGLRTDQAKKYSRLMMEAEGIRLDIRRELNVAKIPSEKERDSAIPANIVKIASDELVTDRGVFDTIAEAAAGTFFGQDTAVDKVMSGENPDVSPSRLYDSFSKTRDALRERFGDTIKLYRAVGKQKEKATQNWHSTRTGALQYGRKVVEKDVPVDDVVALNVGSTGTYEEFIVGKRPTAAAARPSPVAAPAPFVLPRELSRSAPRYGMATISFSSDLDRAAYVLANDAIKPSKAAPKFRAAVGAAGLSVSEVVAHGNKVKAAIKQEAGGGAAPRSELEIRLPEIPFAATPDTPAQRSRRRIKNMTAQSGAIDLSIVEDLVEYGKTIYRAGMSFGKWAGQMVKEFGQGIASFLKQVFDRIVQAYKDSRFSDQAGAVNVTGLNAARVASQQDADYLAAVERGDMEAAQRMVDEAAKAAGYNIRAYHGSTETFDSFKLKNGDIGIHVGTQGQANDRLEWLQSINKGELPTRIIESYVRLENPIRLEDVLQWNWRTLESQLREKFPNDTQWLNAKPSRSTKDIREFLASKRHDGAIYKNYSEMSGAQSFRSAIDGLKNRIKAQGLQSNRAMQAELRKAKLQFEKYGEENAQDSYIVFSPSQIKSAAPVTRDDQGNVIPLSQRFDAGNDIRGKLKTRIQAALANSQTGGIDASVLADIVEFGGALYQNGMTLGKWSAEMVAEFGQAVAKYLKEAFDRIVQAYKDSPYSDTTGAVGDVRPKAKPRQFEQKAKKSDAITEEAKAELGSEYVPITLQGTADQAKEWINQNGIDAAEQRILDLAADSLTPTPVDFGIGLELAARLGAMGEHQRQARVVRIMSNRATSIGQTISVLAMLSRLTPEGIVFYANQIIEQHIDSLPEERQKQIRAAQDSVVSAETEVKATRKTVAEDTIINGTQGGEKIQEKLKRRIKDKTQKQRTNVGIRSVLTSKATKAEATKQITQLLTENGISESEAGALATAITSKFYKVMDEARKSIATQRKPKEPKLLKIWSRLVAKLNGEGMPDDDFVASLSLVAKLPTMTPQLGAKLKDLTRQLKEAKGDEDMQLVIAGRIFEEIHSLIPVDFWIKVRAFSYLMMLFSPKTWIRNIGGNVIQWVANAGADTAINFAGGRSSIFGNGKTGDRVKPGRLKSLLTPIWDVQRGFEWNAKQNPQATFGQNLAAGIDHLRLLSKLTTQNKFEVADAKEVGRRIFSSKFMNMLETSLSIALGGPDRAFWKSALESSLANREARARQMGEWTGRHTPEDIDGAFADAAAAIYQNANTISKTASKWRSSLNYGSTKLLSYFLPGIKPTEQFGFGTALMAFTQVPGAIARTAINWSPLGLITNLSQAMNGILWKASNQRAGKPFNQQEFAQAFTRALGGTGIYVAGYYLYAMGVITASQEDDDDVEAMRRASGMGQYRINVTALKRLITTMAWGSPQSQRPEDGDLILSYDWAQPLAITFAAGAELAKMVEQNDRNGIKKGLAAKAAMPAISLAAGAKSLLELPLLSGLSSFIDQIDTKRPETIVGAISRTVLGMPSMFVPQMSRQLNQLMDNTARETRGVNASSAIPVTVQRAFNQIAANTPGVADQFPPRMDIMGVAQERYQYGSNHWFNVLINPALTSQVKTNPALQEVERLMQTTGETSQFPRAVSRMADINGKRIDLTNEQITAYQYYLGNYTMSMFNWRMASPRYARLPDTEKVRLLAQDLEDVNAATKSALFGHDVQRLTRRQRSMRNNLVNSPLGQSMPPR